MKVQTGPWGTKEKPQVVPSMFEERIVGCICELGLLVCAGHYITLVSVFCFDTVVHFLSLIRWWGFNGNHLDGCKEGTTMSLWVWSLVPAGTWQPYQRPLNVHCFLSGVGEKCTFSVSCSDVILNSDAFSVSVSISHCSLLKFIRFYALMDVFGHFAIKMFVLNCYCCEDWKTVCLGAGGWWHI